MLAAVRKISDGGAMDDDDMSDDADAAKAKDEEAVEAQKRALEAANNKSAMDAAIAAAVKLAEDNTVKRLRDIADAEALVKPYVGNLIAQDSAEATYKLALDTMGVKTDGIHPSAYRAIIEAQPKPGAARVADPVRTAADAALGADISKRYPHHNRLRSVA